MPRLVAPRGSGDLVEAVRGTIPGIGMAMLPGKISESQLVPLLVKILKQGRVTVDSAKQMALDAVTSGKISSDEMKMVLEAMKQAERRVTPGASRLFAAVVEEAPKRVGPSLDRIASMLGTKFKVTRGVVKP